MEKYAVKVAPSILAVDFASLVSRWPRQSGPEPTASMLT